MLRNFVKLVNEAVDEGYSRGINLFMEQLETDLSKDEIFESHGPDKVMAHLFEQAGITAEEEELESIDEGKIDAMLDELEKDAG